jgi:hypothetical protein
MSGWRELRKEEVDLISAIVKHSPRAAEILRSLPECLVEDMKDGAMGSVRFKFMDKGKRHLGGQLAEAEFTDEDGTLVSAAVNVDDRGRLFELDLWKADFSPLKRYPRPEQVRVKRPAKGSAAE